MFSKKINNFIVLSVLGLMASACGGNTSEQDIAVIVALTQTAAVLQSPAASTETAIPATATSTTTPLPTATLQPTATVSLPGYYPITNDECTSLQNALTSSLGVAPTVLNPAPFNDFVNNMSGTACQLTYTGNGNNDFSTGVDVFISDGWADANDYAAGGAKGFARAFQKNGALCLYTFSNGPADKSFCAPDMFFPDCMASLTPEQVLQTVTVSCARYVP